MDLHFDQINPEVDELIYELMRRTNVNHPAYIREMILCALKSGIESDYLDDLRLINNTMKEMRYTNKAFGPYRDRKKVTIFGSARTKPEEKIYQQCVEFSKKVAEHNMMVITGGGPGIMQAGNEGATKEHSFAVNIQLPFEQGTNYVMEGDGKSINYRYFFNRKVAFLKEAHAVVLFPGGFGTLDEMMETLTLIQTGKTAPVPLILFEDEEKPYWAPLLDFVENVLLERGLISREDLRLYRVTSDIDEAVKIIEDFYSVYHSIRFVKDKLVIRLNKSLSDEQVAKINEEYSEIMLNGNVASMSPALEEEDDQPELIHLPRLVFEFDRRNYGALKELIRQLNEF